MQVQSPGFNKRVNEIHDKYISIISPFIMQLEVLDGEFPVEILNEIRAIFGHLSKCHLTDVDEIIERNMQKAESHMKRAIVDCFKYMCFAYDDKYTEFENKYIDIDLSDVDNGDFLPLLLCKRKVAIDELIEAKGLELKATNEDEIYEKFEAAFNAYAEVYNLVYDSFEKLERVKKKANNRETTANRRYRTGTIIGLGGLFVGIAGIIIGIIF